MNGPLSSANVFVSITCKKFKQIYKIKLYTNTQTFK